MKKLLVLPFLLLLAACGDSFDREGFTHVREYADAIVPATEVAILEPTEENASRIDEINNQYWQDSTFMGIEDTEIEGWLINMSGAGGEWNIIGDDLADMLYDLEFSSDWLTDEIYEGEVERSAVVAQEAINEARRILANQ